MGNKLFEVRNEVALMFDLVKASLIPNSDRIGLYIIYIIRALTMADMLLSSGPWMTTEHRVCTSKNLGML